MPRSISAGGRSSYYAHMYNIEATATGGGILVTQIGVGHENSNTFEIWVCDGQCNPYSQKRWSLRPSSQMCWD